MRDNMGNILFFDTETSGFFSNNLSLNDPCQQRVLQVAWLVSDHKFDNASIFNYYVKPLDSKLYNKDGWFIHPRAAEVHGITLEFCDKVGVPMSNILSMLYHTLQTVDSVCAHSVEFDCRAINTEYRRDGRTPLLEGFNKICTKKLSDSFRKRNNVLIESSSLDCMYKHFVGSEMKGGHNAIYDVIACKEVYKHIKNMENKNDRF